MMKSRPSTARTRTKTRRIVIPIRLVLSLTSLLIFSTVLNVNVKCMPLSSQSILIPSLATASAQTGEQDQQTKPSSPTSSSTSQVEFRFALIKLGVLSPIYQRILYDSETNSLTLNNISAAINRNNDSGRFSSSQGQSQSQSNKQISDSDQKNLQQMIEQNGFFQTNSTYPPNTDRDQQNYDTLYVLSIEMGNRLHTVLWMDTSKNIPTGIPPIVKTIEKIASAQQ
jgi:hypothetical protein